LVERVCLPDVISHRFYREKRSKMVQFLDIKGGTLPYSMREMSGDMKTRLMITPILVLTVLSARRGLNNSP
jgi:hypothetical protein